MNAFAHLAYCIIIFRVCQPIFDKKRIGIAKKEKKFRPKRRQNAKKRKNRKKSEKGLDKTKSEVYNDGMKAKVSL